MTANGKQSGCSATASRREFIEACGSTAALAALASGIPISSPAAEPLKVAGLYSVPVSQRWIMAIHAALKGSIIRGEIIYEFADGLGDEDFEFEFRRHSESQIDLIVGDAFGREELVRYLAGQYPGKSCLFGSAFKSDARFPNVAIFDNYIQDASYLSGLIAAGLSIGGVVGIVGRHRFASSNRLINAFMDGASEFRPDVRFLIGFLEAWHDVERAQALTGRLVSLGADVLYSDAVGPEEVARQSGIPVIGTVADMHYLIGEPVVTSAVWRFGPTLRRALQHLKDGSFRAEDYGIYSHMAFGGCELAPITAFPERISDDTKELVALRESQIRSQKFAAFIDDSDPSQRVQAELVETR